MAYKRVWLFGFVKNDGRWQRTSWDFHIGIPLPKKEKHHAVRPWLFGTFIRIVEWPWSSINLQFYYRHTLKKEFVYYKQK